MGLHWWSVGIYGPEERRKTATYLRADYSHKWKISYITHIHKHLGWRGGWREREREKYCESIWYFEYVMCLGTKTRLTIHMTGPFAQKQQENKKPIYCPNFGDSPFPVCVSTRVWVCLWEQTGLSLGLALSDGAVSSPCTVQSWGWPLPSVNLLRTDRGPATHIWAKITHRVHSIVLCTVATYKYAPQLCDSKTHTVGSVSTHLSCTKTHTDKTHTREMISAGKNCTYNNKTKEYSNDISGMLILIQEVSSNLMKHLVSELYYLLKNILMVTQSTF